MAVQNLPMSSALTLTGSVTSKTLPISAGSYSTAIVPYPVRDRRGHGLALGAEIDRFVLALFEFAHQVLDRTYVGLEAGRAERDQTDQVAVRSAHRAIAILVHQFHRAI